jgi:hypothetical protein
MGQLGELVYEHGKRCLEELLSCGAHSHHNIGSKVLLWHSLAQSLYYVPPQSDRIVVLLVEGDPGEGQVGFFCLTPLGQERRLPVAGRGANEGSLVVRGFLEECEQPGTEDLLGARRRRLQLGLEDNPGRISARIARGLNDTFSSVQRRYLEPCTLTARPMRHHFSTTTPQDNINSFSMMANDHSNWPIANLFFPFPAGTPWIPTNVDYRTSDSKVVYLNLPSASESLHGDVPLATSVALRTSDASRSANRLGVAEIPKRLSPARNHRVRSTVATCAKCRSAVNEDQNKADDCERMAAILLRVRPLSKKSPRLYIRVGDEGFPTTRVHCHTQEAVSARKQRIHSRSWKGL